MSYDASVISTAFRVASEEGLALIESLCEKHMEDYADIVPIEQEWPSKEEPSFRIGCDLAYVGDSFAERLQAWATAMGPHLLDAFRVTLTNTDDPSDDRQTFIWGGPTRESIEAFQTKCAVEAAKDELGAPGSASRQAMLDLLLADPQLKLPNQQPLQSRLTVAQEEQSVPEIFVVVNNNAVSEVFSTHSIKARVIDLRADEDEVLDGVYEVPHPPGRGVTTTALVSGIDVQVAPDYCAQIDAACDAQDAPKGRNSPSSRN